MVSSHTLNGLPDDIRQQLLAFADSGDMTYAEISEVAVALKQRLRVRAMQIGQVLVHKKTPPLPQRRGM